jgi:hypothetical protein
MQTPTHATLATFRMDLAREAEQRAGLEQMIVPGVRKHPGFVAGTWALDRDTAETFVMLSYASRESAEAMKTSILGNAENQRSVGIELVAVRVLEVSATATAG